jgi:hypothetical protein
LSGHEVPVYDGNAFKAGLSKLEATVDGAWQLDADTPGAMGKFRLQPGLEGDRAEPCCRTSGPGNTTRGQIISGNV